MRIKHGRVSVLALLMFMLSLVVFPSTSSAQNEVFYPDYGNISGGGSAQGGSCSYCDQYRCGCYDDYGGGAHLIEWLCACDTSNPHGVCYQVCWYEAD